MQRLAATLRHRILALLLGFVVPWPALATVGLIEMPADERFGRLVVVHPTTAAPQDVVRGPFKFKAAIDGPLDRTNRRLIVISHGSTASPWLTFDLATALVEAGYVVAMPVHQGDNTDDLSDIGPTSWKRRPIEISAAIDRLQQDGRFRDQIDFNQVGMYGMSAGGLTALALAGGEWSPARLKAHCEANIRDDPHTCGGPTFSLKGGALDGFWISVVQGYQRWELADTTAYGHVDGRITAIVAGVPFAANFDFETLRRPRAALAIISAQQDRWLVPRFHSDAVLAACSSCDHLLDLEKGSHGALLSPLPPIPASLDGLIGDPAGFDRAVQVPRINAKIVGWFNQQLFSRTVAGLWR